MKNGSYELAVMYKLGLYLDFNKRYPVIPAGLIARLEADGFTVKQAAQYIVTNCEIKPY